MTRSEAFQYSQYWPCTDKVYEAELDQASGSVTFLNPTSAVFHARPYAEVGKTDVEANTVSSDCSIDYLWSSRNNRKGIHTLAISSPAFPTQLSLPGSKQRPHGYHEVIRRMFWTLPYYDTSYLIAVLSVFSSLLWLVDGIILWLPSYKPETEQPGQITYGGGILALIGTCCFLFTSLIGILEAVNENRTICFGWLIKDYDHLGNGPVYLLRPGVCCHHHTNRDSFLTARLDEEERNRADLESQAASQEWPTQKSFRTWRWIPTRHELLYYYSRDLGFLAAVWQLVAVIIYLAAAIPRMPGLYGQEMPVTAIGLWIPKVIGGIIISFAEVLTTLECQTSWYIPEFSKIGWQIGLFSFIGAVGFTLSSFLIMFSGEWQQNQAGLATIWGAFAFLVASVLLLWECFNKYPLKTSNCQPMGYANDATYEKEQVNIPGTSDEEEAGDQNHMTAERESINEAVMNEKEMIREMDTSDDKDFVRKDNYSTDQSDSPYHSE